MLCISQLNGCLNEEQRNSSETQEGWSYACMLLRMTELSCCRFCCTVCLRTPVLHTHYCSQCADSKLLLCLFHHICLVIAICFSPFLSLGQDVQNIFEELRYKARLDVAHHANCAWDSHCAMTCSITKNGWKWSTTKTLGLRTKFSIKEIINERRSY